jgi:4-hydroxybenzoate polyprenyltransferase
MLALALLFGLYWKMGIAWWVVFSLMSLAILYIHLFRKSDDLDSLNRDFFLANVGVSVLVMLGLIFWVIFGGSALG